MDHKAGGEDKKVLLDAGGGGGGSDEITVSLKYHRKLNYYVMRNLRDTVFRSDIINIRTTSGK